MGLPQLKDNRRHLRRPLMGDLSGRLLVAAGERAIPCLAVDVSVQGLRVLSREELVPGTAMLLAFEHHCLPLVVVWCQREGKRQGSYACGLMASAPACNLEQFFTDIGWLVDGSDTRMWLGDIEFVDRSET